jgi:hypothetical protein
VIAGRLRPAQFQPIERRFAGDRRAVLASRRKLAGQNRHHRIVSKRVVIVQILIPQSDPEHPLADQRLDLMLDQFRHPDIPKAQREPINQTNRPIRRPKQQPARVRRDRSTVKRSDNRTTFDTCKSIPLQATLCRHRGTPLKPDKSFSQNNFLRFNASMHLPSVRYPG